MLMWETEFFHFILFYFIQPIAWKRKKGNIDTSIQNLYSATVAASSLLWCGATSLDEDF